MDEFLILLQAKLDEAKSKGNIDSDIDKIQQQIDKLLKIQAEIDPKSISDIISKMTKLGIQVGQDFGKAFNNGLSSTINTNVLSQINKISDSSTSTIIQNEKKKQEAYKATSDAVVYHAGVISKLNKAETNGRFYGSNRGTGYFGTGHYFVDSKTKHELDNNSSYSKLPYTSVDISKYDNLFKATTDEVASKLHNFLENLTRFTQGSDRFNIDELFSQFKNVFTDTTMDIKDFGDKMEQLKTFMSNSNLSDRSDSVSTQFMKSLGYGGVDTRGTKYADTRYGTVIYDLKEESVLQANITDELQKQGQMLEKINYEKGQVFDSSADVKIQEQIDAQRRLAEVQAEFKNSFNRTNLDSSESELNNAQKRLTEIDSIISDCKHEIDNADESAIRFAKDMEDLGLEVSDAEMKEWKQSTATSYQQRIDELSLERAELEKRIPVLEENYNKESQLASEAYKQAEQIVEQRRLESQQSSSIANEVIQNEEKKQQATQESIKLQSELASFNENFKETGIATINNDGVVDLKASLKEVRDIYSDLGKVTIKNEMTNLAEGAEQFRVSIESSNGELKRTESFLMKLSEDGKSFVFIDDKIQSSESVVRKLNEQKDATDKVVLAEEKLANAMADVREKSEQARQAEEKRQESAQNKAINKALEEEYKERQKNIQAAEKQAELDRKKALAFTESASKKLSSAISKYSYGNSSDATAMMKQMNRGLSNFGDLSNVQGNITQLSSAVDKIISDLKTSHEQSLQALNAEIKAEQTLQSQKDNFNQKNLNAIDYEIQKREQEARAFSAMLKSQMQERQKLAEQVDDIRRSIGDKGDTTAQIKVLRDNLTKLGLSADEVSSKMNGADKEIIELKSLMNSGANDSAIVTQFGKLKAALKETQNDLKSTRSEYSLLVSAQQRLSKANEIESWNQKNSKATKQVRSANEAYIASLRDLNSQMTKMQFNEIINGFKQSEISMRGINRLGASLKDQMSQAAQSFTQWLSVSSAVMFLFSKTKNAISELKEVNTLLTEISKANDKLSKSDLNNIGNDSFDTASKYGKTATDYLEGVKEASRAGYENAKEIAELSVAAQGAGDMTAKLANQYIIATDKAYKMGGSVEKLTAVLDGSNYITNHNAVNMTELAEGMSVVGSQAASLGVKVNETTAVLGTMIATTQQSGSEMARAFKAILLNLQQVTDEEEGINSEGLTKYENACKALNVSLKETKNGITSLRNPMEVIKDLAAEYSKLDSNDIRRTNLLSSVGGKLRANALNAILENYDMYEKMLQEYANGTGSMAAEAEKTANSLEGSLIRLDNTWTDTVENIADSDAIITIINGLNDFLSVVNNVTDKLGSFGTIGAASGLIMNLKGIGKTITLQW